MSRLSRAASRACDASSSKTRYVASSAVDDSETEDESDSEWIQSMQPKTVSEPAKKHPQPIIIVDSDSEDSNSVSTASKLLSSSRATSSNVPANAVDLDKTKETSQPAFLSDRAQMEAERLARRKRTLGDSDTIAGNDAKRQRTTPPPLASRMFYDGAFFPTYTIHANPRADGREAIRFEEVVGKSGLKLAILSSYGFSPESSWLPSYIDSSIPVIMVVGKEDSGPSTARFGNSNLIITAPRLSKGGCMHMKYMLLFYGDGRLRVVVSTANLVSQDWKHLENMVFIQDLASLSASSRVLGSGASTQGTTPVEHDFATIFENVLRATNVRPALELMKQTHPAIPFRSISDLSKQWDWSRVTAQLVASIAGKYEGWSRIKTTGHPRLLQALDALGLANSKDHKLVIECQGSSIGSYTTQWLNQFYISASGHLSALKGFLDLSEGKRRKLDCPTGVKVVFSTFETVMNSSRRGVNSLFCDVKKWEAKNFPQGIMYDSKSRAGKALMHTKQIIATFKQKKASKSDSEPSGPAGWMYVGSHNFTLAAWGNLSGTRDKPQLTVNNFELGVVVPLTTVQDVDMASAWERPPQKYGKGDVPWMKELHEEICQQEMLDAMMDL
ncbi:tyrosyl-DNA phosphodiesterase-domain-containing protein [Favolaschia claudopus]|uniref:Tyrosyl-DNA phosphodiesterase-domain-containing protein n=1 Tax=Favolaschia claudopus TaxID=2862362 RepID=A0AAW0BZS1_9AGAR